MTDSGTNADIRIIARDVFGDGEWTEWFNPFELLTAEQAVDVPKVLARVEQANADGHTALGFVTYEAGPAFDQSFAVKPSRGPLPLAWFAVFQTHIPYAPAASQPDASPPEWIPTLEQNTYREGINRIKDCIASGETYQVNYTFALTTRDTIDPRAWFHEMYRRQPTPYAMLIETPAFNVISLSPELFFRKDGASIVCEPMKGTAPRAPHPKLEDTYGRVLRDSKKNRAENIMIVDMVRNDLGRIAGTHAVRVDELFKTSLWPTLWQMTSVISAKTRANIGEVFQALFPSASITGAPKLQTSRIIAELEDHPRGLYTGAIGWSLPGHKARFSVAIRTAVQDKANGITRYGIGSGIVWDSDADSEFDECMLKAMFMKHGIPCFQLLETLRWDRSHGYRFLAEHLKRLSESADYFGFILDPDTIRTALDREVSGFSAEHIRIRLVVDCAGRPSITSTVLKAKAAYEAADAEITYMARIDDRRHPTDSPFLYHKTTNRSFYEEARARNSDVDEVLLVNERGQIMEFSTGNLVLCKGDRWLTPALESGLLSGVLRDHLLEREVLNEAVITVDDIQTADEIYFINSVRGWIRIKLLD